MCARTLWLIDVASFKIIQLKKETGIANNVLWRNSPDFQFKWIRDSRVSWSVFNKTTLHKVKCYHICKQEKYQLEYSWSSKGLYWLWEKDPFKFRGPTSTRIFEVWIAEKKFKDFRILNFKVANFVRGFVN